MVHLDLLCDGFFTWQVNEDDHNSSQHVITLDQGGLTLPNREHYLKQNYTQLVEALKKVMFRVVKLLILDNNDQVSFFYIRGQIKRSILGFVFEVRGQVFLNRLCQSDQFEVKIELYPLRLEVKYFF